MMPTAFQNLLCRLRKCAIYVCTAFGTIWYEIILHWCLDACLLWMMSRSHCKKTWWTVANNLSASTSSIMFNIARRSWSGGLMPPHGTLSGPSWSTKAKTTSALEDPWTMKYDEGLLERRVQHLFRFISRHIFSRSLPSPLFLHALEQSLAEALSGQREEAYRAVRRGGSHWGTEMEFKNYTWAWYSLIGCHFVPRA